MESSTRVQILNEVDCVSFGANSLGKSMNPFILVSAMDKPQDKMGSLTLVRQTDLKQRKLQNHFFIEQLPLIVFIQLLTRPSVTQGRFNGGSQQKASKPR